MRDVLLLGPRQVVFAFDVAPENRFRQLGSFQHGFFILFEVIFDLAPAFHSFSLGFGRSQLERIARAKHLLVELGFVLVQSPVFLDRRPVALSLDLNRVDSAFDVEETVVTPSAAPRVTHNPLGHTIAFAKTNHADVVVDFIPRVVVDMHRVLVFAHEGVGVHTACDRTALHDFLHHCSDVVVILSGSRAQCSPFFDMENVVRIRAVALGIVAVQAHKIGAAGAAIVQTQSLIVRATFFGQTVGLDLFVG